MRDAFARTIPNVKGRVGGRNGGAVQMDRCRMAAARVWRAVPADRPPPLLPQALCPGCRPPRSRPAHQSAAGCGDEGTRSGECRVGRDVTRRRDANRDLGRHGPPSSCAAMRRKLQWSFYGHSASPPCTHSPPQFRRLPLPLSAAGSAAMDPSAARSCGASSG